MSAVKCFALSLIITTFSCRVQKTNIHYRHFASFNSFQKELKKNMVFEVVKNGDTVNIGGSLYVVKYDY